MINIEILHRWSIITVMIILLCISTALKNNWNKNISELLISIDEADDGPIYFYSIQSFHPIVGIFFANYFVSGKTIFGQNFIQITVTFSCAGDRGIF